MQIEWCWPECLTFCGYNRCNQKNFFQCVPFQWQRMAVFDGGSSAGARLIFMVLDWFTTVHSLRSCGLLAELIIAPWLSQEEQRGNCHQTCSLHIPTSVSLTQCNRGKGKRQFSLTANTAFKESKPSSKWSSNWKQISERQSRKPICRAVGKQSGNTTKVCSNLRRWLKQLHSVCRFCLSVSQAFLWVVVVYPLKIASSVNNGDKARIKGAIGCDDVWVTVQII